MSSYIVVLAGFGALVLLTAWLPMVLKEAPLSLPIVCVALGAALWAIPGLPGVVPDPRANPALTERLTEIVVLISLMGAGLKIDRPMGWRSWAVTWRLLGVAMPLTIVALTLIAWGLLGLALPTALLLGALLAPTDPVLASDIQVGPPQSGQEDETRFALTSEAGLNDALAFPFVLLALALAGSAGSGGEAWLLSWFGVAVLWKIGAACVIGAALGYGFGWLVFHMPNRAKLSRTGDGFVALGITAVVYGATEMASAYGFLAVFIAARSLRAAERDHAYHETLHDFAEQLERLLMMVLLVIFGGALVNGELLAALDWRVVAFAAFAIFLVRPVAGWIGLSHAGCPTGERAAISFYGIRGLGSVYYLAYALSHGPDAGAQFERPDLLWTVVSLTVAISIALHGVTVTPVMRWLDRRTGRADGDQLELPLVGGAGGGVTAALTAVEEQLTPTAERT